jgi:hypothetical protein
MVQRADILSLFHFGAFKKDGGCYCPLRKFCQAFAVDSSGSQIASERFP